MAELATMQTKFSRTLSQHRTRYKCYFEKNFWSLPYFSVGQMVYVDQSPLRTVAAAWLTFARYNKLVSSTMGTFKRLKTRDHFLTIDENGIANTI